jgi:hypothetical protein
LGKPPKEPSRPVHDFVGEVKEILPVVGGWLRRTWGLLVALSVIVTLVAFFFHIQSPAEFLHRVFGAGDSDVSFSVGRYTGLRGSEESADVVWGPVGPQAADSSSTASVTFTASNLRTEPVNIEAGLYTRPDAPNYSQTLKTSASFLTAMSKAGLNEINVVVKPGETRTIVDHPSVPLWPGLWTLVLKTSVGVREVVVTVESTESPDGR